MKNNKHLETYFSRMVELSDIKKDKPQHTNLNTTLVESVKANDGTVLGIVKDAHNYYIKKTTSKDANLTESHFAFIGGLENKNEYKYDSLGDAQKQLNLFVKSMNENFSKDKKIKNSKKQQLSEDKKLEDPNSWIKSMISEGKKEEKVEKFNKFKESMHLNESTEDINEDDEIEDKLDNTSDALEDLDNDIKSDDSEKEETGGEEEVSDGEVSDDDTESGEEELNLDDLDIDDSEKEEVSDEETGGEEKVSDEETGGEEEVSDDDTESGEELDEKEMEKLIGKLTYKVRNSNLTPDQAKSFLKSILSSFKSELSDIDLEDRKQMSNTILKAESDEEDVNEEEDYRDEKGEVPGEQDTGSHEYEEEKEECEECGNFNSYMSERGYDDTDGVTAMEIANVISSYLENKDGLSDSDLSEVAKYCTEEVKTELTEYGHVDEVDKLEPFIKKINETDGMKFGSHEADFNPDDINIGENEMDDVVDNVTGSMEGKEETPENTSEPTIASPADSMGVSSPSTSKLDVNLKTGDATLTVNEEKEKKIRKYIRNRIEEKMSNKKPSLNESKKSNKMKKLDTLIDKTLLKLTK